MNSPSLHVKNHDGNNPVIVNPYIGGEEGNVISKILSCENIALAVSVVATVGILGWLLGFSRYGFDFTDEAFYLVWMANPFQYTASVSQFGFVYHPLYILLDGNIAALRQANIIILFGLAWMSCGLFFQKTFDIKFKSFRGVVLSAGFATASLVFFSMWLLTPSYNSLTFQSLLLSTFALLLWNKQNKNSYLACFLMGIGGWLALMSKPTSAVGLALLSFFYLWISKKLKWSLVTISITTVVILFFISAWIIDGSPIAYIKRLQEGLVFVKLLDAGQMSFSFFKMHSLMISKMHLYGLLILSIPAILFLTTCLFYRKAFRSLTRTDWATILLLAALPHVYTIGTNINYWIVSKNAGLFWILAGLVFLVPFLRESKTKWILISLVFATQGITAIILQIAISNPYRQTPLQLNQSEISIGKSPSPLIVSDGFKKYIIETVEIAEASGFKKGTGMIDLTGQSPGILYALQAQNLGQAWMIGGYSGSNALAIEALKKVSVDELASAWILTEPNGDREISPEILKNFGLALERDYICVGSVMTAPFTGGYSEPRLQYLWKPNLDKKRVF